MRTLKVTQALRSAIYQAARAKLSERANLLLEAGYREAKDGQGEIFQGAYTVNARLWTEDADLSDMVKLRNLKEVALDESGRCELDLYCYAGPVRRGMDARQLTTNVSVLFDASGVLDTCDVGEWPQVAFDRERATLWGMSEETIKGWEEARERARQVPPGERWASYLG